MSISSTGMSFKQFMKSKFKLLVRSIYPTNELLNQLSFLDFFTDKIASIEQRNTPEDRNGLLLRNLISIPPDECESLLAEFLSILRDHGQDHVAYIFDQSVGKQPMTDEHYELLSVKRADLRNFIDPFNGLVDNLRQRGVFAEIDVSRVVGLGNTNYDAPALEIINTVIRKSDCAFDVFVDELCSNNQEHVAYILTGKGEPPMTPNRVELLMQQRQNLLHFIDSERTSLVDNLFQNGVINVADKKRMDSDKDPWNKNEVLLTALVRKSYSAFDKFIEALIGNNQKQVAAAIHGLELETVLVPILRGQTPPAQREGITICLIKCLKKLEIMGKEFDLSTIYSLLESNGIKVSYVGEGSILIRFRCLSKQSLLNLQQLYVSGTLDRMFTDVFLPSLREEGLESLKFETIDENFEKCLKLFDELALMTVEHRQKLSKAASILIDQITVTDELLDKLPLCTRYREIVANLQSNQEKVKILLEIVSRQADIMFGQLVDVLRKTHQDEAADFLDDNGEFVKKLQAVPLELEDAVLNMAYVSSGLSDETASRDTESEHFIRLSTEQVEQILLVVFIQLFTNSYASHSKSRRATRRAYRTLAGVCGEWNRTINNWKQTQTGEWVKQKLIPSCKHKSVAVQCTESYFRTLALGNETAGVSSTHPSTNSGASPRSPLLTTAHQMSDEDVFGWPLAWQVSHVPSAAAASGTVYDFSPPPLPPKRPPPRGAAPVISRTPKLDSPVLPPRDFVMTDFSVQASHQASPLPSPDTVLPKASSADAFEDKPNYVTIYFSGGVECVAPASANKAMLKPHHDYCHVGLPDDLPTNDDCQSDQSAVLQPIPTVPDLPPLRSRRKKPALRLGHVMRRS